MCGLSRLSLGTPKAPSSLPLLPRLPQPNRHLLESNPAYQACQAADSFVGFVKAHLPYTGYPSFERYMENFDFWRYMGGVARSAFQGREAGRRISARAFEEDVF